LKGKSDNKDRITKTGDLPKRTTEELESSKDINENGERSYEKAI